MSQSYKASYAPELEHAKSIARSLEEFRLLHLSNTTSITHLSSQPGSEIHESTLTDEADIRATVQAETNSPLFQFLFVNLFELADAIALKCANAISSFVYKHLLHNSSDPIPHDANKLRISRSCFESLANQLMLPASFIFSLARHYLPNGQGSRKIHMVNNTSFEFWYFLPIRIQFESRTSKATTDKDYSNQMNPFHKLHLPDVQLDIHRSCVGIFSRVDPVSKRFTFFAIDFMHGRWPRVALEPKERILEVLRRQATSETAFGREFHVHLVYLSSATRWWTNALNSVNEQLIVYERKLQSELDSEGTSAEPTLTELNRALHSVAAHLYRYLSELQSMKSIVTDLLADYKSVHHEEISSGKLDDLEEATRGYSMILSSVEATYQFAVELEKKTQNILALLFNRIQINNDRLLVANGQAMQAILRAMQEDANLSRQMAKRSHTLAQEMKKDSIAMKTIAIVTMFFLPGATFAALLSMPFFDNEEWMGHADRFWVWVALTLPSTTACFVFYKVWRRRARMFSNTENDANKPEC
ncbi:hypothetical protein FALBO_1914 [Fusarium albosuccineum]|uniref:Uncharacterized protein n=1 Tax=Fusarium albosuccineum TaxID=1237068 RepID=A0A8H4LLZ0_9HYPO|nr:hypothetical protein FALBO_1914 [Fusarium albosuccineum]